MAPFVGDRRHRFVVVVVVHQHVGVHVVGVARHVRARLLVRARIGVHPAAVEAVGQRGDVFPAQRRDGIDDELPALRIGKLEIAVHERRIDVVVVELRHAEQLRAEPEIPIKRRQAGVGLRNQRVEHRDRNIVAVERARDRVRVLAHLGVHRILLQLRIQVDADRALVGLERAEERIHHALAIVALRGFAVFRVGRGVERHLLAGGELDLGHGMSALVRIE